LRTGCWREKRKMCDGVWEHAAWERKGQIVTVVENKLLEKREGRMSRCFKTGCCREER